MPSFQGRQVPRRSGAAAFQRQLWPRHERRSEDWDHQGTCLRTFAEPAWDDYTTWTGSVVRGDDDLWHLFYTGSTHAEDGKYQRIGHATSTDLHSWARVGDGFCLDLEGPNAEAYDADFGRRSGTTARCATPGSCATRRRRLADVFHRARPASRTQCRRRDRICHIAGSPHGRFSHPSLSAATVNGSAAGLRAGGRWYCLFCTHAEHFSKAAPKHAWRPGHRKPLSGRRQIHADHGAIGGASSTARTPVAAMPHASSIPATGLRSSGLDRSGRASSSAKSSIPEPMGTSTPTAAGSCGQPRQAE
jgi:hypothetical protein